MYISLFKHQPLSFRFTRTALQPTIDIPQHLSKIPSQTMCNFQTDISIDPFETVSNRPVPSSHLSPAASPMASTASINCKIFYSNRFKAKLNELLKLTHSPPGTPHTTRRNMNARTQPPSLLLLLTAQPHSVRPNKNGKTEITLMINWRTTISVIKIYWTTICAPADGISALNWK